MTVIVDLKSLPAHFLNVADCSVERKLNPNEADDSV